MADIGAAATPSLLSFDAVACPGASYKHQRKIVSLHTQLWS